MKPDFRFVLALALPLCGVSIAFAEPLTPVQAAYVEAQTRKADAHFVRTVARISSRPESMIRRAMPPAGRIADPAERVIATLEAERKAPLPEEMRNQIVAAEAVRRMSIANARELAERR